MKIVDTMIKEKLDENRNFYELINGEWYCLDTESGEYIKEEDY